MLVSEAARTIAEISFEEVEVAVDGFVFVVREGEAAIDGDGEILSITLPTTERRLEDVVIWRRIRPEHPFYQPLMDAVATAYDAEIREAVADWRASKRDRIGDAIYEQRRI